MTPDEWAALMEDKQQAEIEASVECPVEVSNRTNSQGALVDWQKCARPLGHYPPHMDSAEIAALLVEVGS